MLPLDEYKEFERQLGYSKDSHSKLIQRAKEAAESNKLPADELFGTLKQIAGVIPHGDDHYAAASRRFHLGNPPGKADSMGDQLNWEILLTEVPECSDIHVLTKDGDYASKLTPTQAKGFLNDEWLARKSGKIHLYEQLSQFFKNNFPAVDFSLETEKRQAIDAFLNSGSFGSTQYVRAWFVGF